MPSAEERFRAKVQRRGGHDIWTGSTDARGAGMVRIGGKLRTVQRAAWEFTHGPLPPGVRVNSCAAERACVRVDHLSLSTGESATSTPTTAPRRRQRGTGSLRELHPGVWQIGNTDGKTIDGRPRRRYATVRGTRADAEQTLAELARASRQDLGDLRVRELVGRYLDELHEQDAPGLERDRRVLHDLIEPELGPELAGDLSPADAERAMRAVYIAEGAERARHALALLRDAYQWAKHQHWCDTNPIDDITVRTLR